MAGYDIYLKESVWKDIRQIPSKDLRNIMARIKGLSQNPRLDGCEKLAGQERYRLRQGKYRILYSIQDKELTVWVVKIGHRRDMYR